MRVLADSGFSTKYAKLKPDAVPSIFARGTASPTADGSAVKRRRTVFSFVTFD